MRLHAAGSVGVVSIGDGDWEENSKSRAYVTGSRISMRVFACESGMGVVATCDSTVARHGRTLNIRKASQGWTYSGERDAGGCCKLR